MIATVHVANAMETVFFLVPAPFQNVFAETWMNRLWYILEIDGVIFHIPTAIGMLASLIRLDLSTCRLQGGIPSEIGKLKSLTQCRPPTLLRQPSSPNGREPNPLEAAHKKLEATREEGHKLRKDLVYIFGAPTEANIDKYVEEVLPVYPS
ncbi:hypothetical protein HDU98_010401, partial [Podochytrium sp. JEL0797]